jgi:pimeloyl-ACP methyl ester carboxylesterase
LTLCSHTDREITVRKAPLAMLFLLTLLATLVATPAVARGPAVPSNPQASAAEEAGIGQGQPGKGNSFDARGPNYVFDAVTPLGGNDTTPLGEGVPLSSIEAPGLETVQGEIAGAGYIGQKPANWNGELVVWAHGYRGEGERLYVDPPPARQWLLDNDYAWIASSYRRNSYDPGIGVLDTKNVTRRAAALWGQPSRTYLVGASMGGHVVGAAIERFPTLYDGALPACGVMGDVELFDYFLDYNLGAAAIAGVDVDYPSETWLDVEVPAIKRQLSIAPTGVPGVSASWAASGFLTEGFSTLTEGGELLKDFVEVRSGGERGEIYDAAWDYWHLGASPTGDFFFELGAGDGTIANRSGIVADNADTDYAIYGEQFAFLNDDVERVEGSNRVRRSQGQQPAPIINGDPSVPVLSIHTIGDLFVPIEMQLVYADRVEANGKSDLLVQRAIRDVGHCTFSGSEWVQSYTDLFAWVTTGDAPKGEDLRKDISEPLLGCDWTLTDGTLGSASLRLFSCG